VKLNRDAERSEAPAYRGPRHRGLPVASMPQQLSWWLL